MKIAIVQFPGSNCERETMMAVKRAGMTPVEFLWNEPASKLAQMDGFVIIGGFSYEDRARAGIIAALDPIMNEIKKQSELGKPILGICNGAQILVETGLVPGLKNNQLGMALTENKRIKDGKVLGTGFYNAWINVKTPKHVKANAFTRHLSTESVLTIPTAHAQGRFVMPDALLEEIEKEGLNCLQYCDEQGQINENFPVNPNGSLGNMAAIINKRGNVMAMMPHPERTKVGDPLFASMRDYILEKTKTTPASLTYAQPHPAIKAHTKSPHSYELLVQLIITDNEAITVQNTLKHLGLGVQVNRMDYWEVVCEDEKALDALKASGLLYNDKKQYLVSSEETTSSNSSMVLVKPKEDLHGMHKMQMLQDHFLIPGIKSIHHGILWQFKSQMQKIEDLIDPILQSSILFNPFSHEGYEYH